MTASVSWSRIWGSRSLITGRSTRRWTASSQISCSFARSGTSIWCRWCFVHGWNGKTLYLLTFILYTVISQMVDAEGDETEEDQWMAGHKEWCWWVSVTAQQLVLDAAAPLTVLKAVVKLIVLFRVSLCALCLQLLLTGGGRGLPPPWRVHLVRGGYQAHAGRGNAERQMWRNLSHPWEPITEGLVRLLCGVSLSLTLCGTFIYSEMVVPIENMAKTQT